MKKRSIFATSGQAKQYRELLFLLKDGPDEVMVKFLDHILAPVPGGHLNIEKQRSGAVFERYQYLECLRNLLRLFFTKISDNDWINCDKIRLIVTHCIKYEVKFAKTAETLFESDVLSTVFSALCEHQNAVTYVNFLFQDLLET